MTSISLLSVQNLNPGLVRSEIIGTSKYPVNMSYNRYPTLSADDITQAVHYILSAPAHVEVG
jgi:NADP-dependent 3-hydroxy acid dehydrogenase YdfG